MIKCQLDNRLGPERVVGLDEGKRRQQVAHAVVVQVRIEPDSDAEHRHSILQRYVVPQVSRLPGFQDGLWLSDGEGTGTCVVAFDTEDHARASLPRLTPEGGPQVVHAAICAVEISASRVHEQSR